MPMACPSIPVPPTVNYCTSRSSCRKTLTLLSTTEGVESAAECPDPFDLQPVPVHHHLSVRRRPRGSLQRGHQASVVDAPVVAQVAVLVGVPGEGGHHAPAGGRAQHLEHLLVVPHEAHGRRGPRHDGAVAHDQHLLPLPPRPREGALQPRQLRGAHPSAEAHEATCGALQPIGHVLVLIRVHQPQDVGGDLRVRVPLGPSEQGHVEGIEDDHPPPGAG
mmetsp:Transcript_10317/g.33297  ORF Transcript_10317/g.33297 Transcript_10317/m.33297 type:complete len:219 (-) Transcript_10317:665-1321(-)